MSRRLSDPEYVAFMEQVFTDPQFLPHLPAHGAIVDWNGQFVLVYQPAGSEEYYLTDITDGIPMGDTVIMPEEYALNVSREIVQEGIEIVYDPAGFGALVESLEDVTRRLGRVAGETIAPIISPISPILIGALVVFAILYFPKPRRS